MRDNQANALGIIVLILVVALLLPSGPLFRFAKFLDNSGLTTRENITQDGSFSTIASVKQAVEDWKNGYGLTSGTAKLLGNAKNGEKALCVPFLSGPNSPVFKSDKDVNAFLEKLGHCSALVYPVFLTKETIGITFLQQEGFRAELIFYFYDEQLVGVGLGEYHEFNKKKIYLSL